MKKSNKFLLGALLTGILLLTGIHIALSAKFKSGNYTAATSEMIGDKNMDTRALANIRELRVENVGYITVRYAATPSMRYTKGSKEIKIAEQGGVMVVTLPKGHDGDGTHNTSVHLYVDSSVMVNLVNSRAYLVNTGERSSHLNLTLNDTYLTTSDDVNPENFFMANLNLKAVNKSEVRLIGINIARLAVDLQQSAFLEDKSVFQDIQLRADDSSRVSLMSANLLKLTKTNINE